MSPHVQFEGVCAAHPVYAPLWGSLTGVPNHF